MEAKQRYTLGKADKLKSRKLIEQLFKEGKSFSVFPLRVLYLYLEAPAFIAVSQISGKKPSSIQTAFSVSKRHFKKAVDRNRVKRLLREAWRLQKNILADQQQPGQKNLSIFIIYTGNELPDYNLIYEKTGIVIKRLIKTSNEAIITNS